MERSTMSKLSNELLAWYDIHRRDLPWRGSKDPYKIWVSEIMLQQTQVNTVKPYYYRFIEALPNVYALSQASEEELHKLWEGLGYYNRVKNMKKAAMDLVENYNGKLPKSKKELMKLSGIGPYTAGAIASIAFNEVVSAIDGNVFRIYTRLYEIDTPIEQVKTKRLIDRKVMDTIDKKQPGEFNQALMDLGNDICTTTKPNCTECPLNNYCLAYSHSTMEEYPVRKAKKKKRVEKRTVLILIHNDKLLVSKRPEGGLLSGLWEFPNYLGHFSKEDVEKLLLEQGYIVNNIESLPKSKHLFSHVEWQMIAYQINLKSQQIMEPITPYGEVLKWISQEEVENDYALPTAFRNYLKEVDHDSVD